MMTPFEYLSVFISIVIGLGVVHVLSGTARMLTNPGIRAYWVHLLWTLNVLYSLSFFWWFTFEWRLHSTWTFELFLFVVAYAMLWYLMSVLFVPLDHPTELDYKEYYYSKHRLIFSLWAFVMLVDTADSILKGADNLAGLGPLFFPTQAFFFLLLVTLAVTKNEKIHTAAVLFWTVTLIPPFQTVVYDVFTG
jgi:hypothetical protein